MSLTNTLTTATSITATKTRTWRVQIETPNGGIPLIEGFRETISLNAAGAAVGDSVKSLTPLALQLTPVAIAALPAQYQPLPGLISAFFDWLEATSGVAAPSAPASPAE